MNCPTCGSAWHLDAAACGSCGWRLPLEGDPASATLCPLCHQSKSVDSLTNRCTRCHPIQIEELDSELQEYARRAQSERFRLFALGILLGPVAIVICLYYSKGSFSTPTLVALILTPVIMGASIYSLNRKGKLLRYYRLGFVMKYSKPLEAELKYDVRGSKYGSTRSFNLCRLGPGSVWPSGVCEKIKVDDPEKENEQTVSAKDFWKKLYQGFDPMERPVLWAKIYFDPDQSGSAVIRIADSVFVSVCDNRPPADLF